MKTLITALVVLILLYTAYLYDQNQIKQKNVTLPASIQNTKIIEPIIPKETTPATICANSTNNPAESRQMWVWADVATNNKELTISGTQTNTDFFNFVDSHKVQVAYVFLPAGFLNDGSKTNDIKNFLNISKKNHCLDIEALDGDTDWIDLNNHYALNFLNAVKNFNTKLSQTDTKIVGLQYDVEPKGITMTVANKFLDMLQTAKDNLSGTGILLDIAPTRWYDTASPLNSNEFIRTGGQKGKSLMQYVFDIVDVMTIQDYTQKDSTIYSGAQGELNYAAEIGKKVRIGVDTAKGDETNTSFGDVTGMTCSKFNESLSNVYNMMTTKEKSGFGGFAVEFYKGKNNTPFSYSLLCP